MIRHLALLTLLATGTGALEGQSPPGPLAHSEPRFPPFELRSLESGAELIVVSEHGEPYVTVDVVFRGGSSADPVRQAGVAALTAELLVAGVQGQRPERLAADLDMIGAELSAAAGPDDLTVSLGTLTEHLDRAVKLLADVVLRPLLPADRLAALVARARGALELQESSATLQASRAFLRELYGEHPYARIQTSATLGRIDVQAVARYHRSYFVPNNAVFVVAGDVDADAAARLLDDHFANWQPAMVRLPSYHGLPRRPAPELRIVHVPDASEAVLRVGHVAPAGDDSDWTALRIANLILGEGPGARLARDPVGGGATDASTALIRRKDAGYFQARARVPYGRAVDAIQELLGRAKELAAAGPQADELRQVQEFVLGGHLLSLETPHEIARQVADAMLLGLDREALETYRGRVDALTPERVREAAKHLVSEASLVVAAGDAGLLLPDLASLGPVVVLDSEGRRLAVEDLEVPEPRAVGTLEAVDLVPMAWDYQVRAQNWPAGEVRRTLRVGEEPGTMVLESAGVIGPRDVRRSVTFDVATFSAREATDELRVQGRVLTARLSIDDGRVTGAVAGPGGEQPVTGEAEPGALLGEMPEILLWITDLDRMDEVRVPLVGQDGSVGWVTLRAKGEREIRVPAGRYDAYEIELDGGIQKQRIFVRKERPRFTVKIEVVGQPVETVLTRVTEGAPNP